MGDIIIARRTLLALGVGIAGGIWPIRPVGARLRAERRPSHARPHPRVIVLDPGHGGIDPGAISPGGTHEKDITLAAARELAHQLDATGRYHCVLTRRGDFFVPLRGRIARARANCAELLLSIHADALPDSAMRGLSVYTLSNEASDRVTAALAIREIRAILLDLARRQTDNLSLTLARAIVAELGRTVPLLERPHRAAGFAVLTAPDMPSALVELGCLSNPADERLLRQHSYQQRLAQGLVRAIDDYFAARIIA
jgi:N-acetylmuramoyl-L-alanine amidase